MHAALTTFEATSLLGGPPFDPLDGCHHKTRSPVGSICAVLSAPMDPFDRRDPRRRCRSTPAPMLDDERGGPRIVTDCLKCCCSARVWLQDQLSGGVTDCL
jgi:hypothetical protein